jgi:cell wall-associated NlpC family hydrolase
MRRILALSAILFALVSGACVSTRDDSARVPAGRTNRVIEIASQQVGVPYVWGGASPSGFDCSGFVQYVFRAVGITLPRDVRRQYTHGVPVRREDLQPGDVIFFDHLRHNGIYIGEGRLIHAARSSRSVAIASLSEGWFAHHWIGARRMSIAPG